MLRSWMGRTGGGHIIDDNLWIFDEPGKAAIESRHDIGDSKGGLGPDGE